MFKCPVFLLNSVADCCLPSTDLVLGVQTPTNWSSSPRSRDQAPANQGEGAGSRDSVWRENIWLQTRRHHALTACGDTLQCSRWGASGERGVMIQI